MIRTLLRIEWIDLRRDRVALLLVFVLPIVFFSIFGTIFTNMGGGGGGPVKLDVLIVDQDGSKVSQRLATTLGAQDGLAVSLNQPPVEAEGDQATSEPEPWTHEAALSAVRKGRADAAIILPRGLQERFGNFGGQLPSVEVLYDAANPMAQFTVTGLLHAASFQSSPDILMGKGLQALETRGGPLTPEQQAAVGAIIPQLEADGAAAATGEGGFSGMLEITATAAHDDEEEEGPQVVAYYAAGIAVMFLLFSMTGAAGGLLEEEETGTLERLLTSNVTMGTLLASRWVFYGGVGVLQLVMMFVWGWAVFDLDMWSAKRIVGFLAMTVVTAAAAASFGLVLAAICRSRAQLSGISTVVILVMSALGGSMVPRFIMPEFMSTVSRFTFNGWALDGYLKVFWYADPEAGLLESLAYLAPQLAVLAGLAVAFFLLARRLARRWEVA
jgi:ABC-2 type transport system permease protein